MLYNASPVDVDYNIMYCTYRVVVTTLAVFLVSALLDGSDSIHLFKYTAE